jgi:hypothetical protein
VQHACAIAYPDYGRLGSHHDLSSPDIPFVSFRKVKRQNDTRTGAGRHAVAKSCQVVYSLL